MMKNTSTTALLQKIKDKRMVIYCLVLAFALLSVTSKSSYLYPFNDWVDVQCFFTVGKGLFNGMVPYLELAEQKGPYVYFIYGLTSLISANSLIGGFVLEVITGTVFLYLVYQITCLYCKQYAIVCVAGVAMLAFSGVMFGQGGSVEEQSLAIWAYALYSVLRLFRQEDAPWKAISYWNGFWMGVLFFAKYTLVGIYIGIAIAIFIYYAYEKNYGRIWGIYLRVLAGFLLAVLPWLAYFWWNHALGAFWEWYFYNNIFIYTSDVGVVARIVQTGKMIYQAGVDSPMNAVALLASLVGLVWHARAHRNWFENTLLLFILLCAMVGVYVGGKGMAYYGLILVALVVPGLAMLLQWVSGALPRGSGHWLLAPCLVVLAMAGAALRCDNLYLMRFEKSDLPQVQFAEIINQSEHPTVLNYGFLDGGFYTAADVLPNEQYFCVLNVLPEEMAMTQFEYIENKTVEFIVLRAEQNVSYQDWFWYLGYTLVSECEFYFEGEFVNYQLYQLASA